MTVIDKAIDSVKTNIKYGLFYLGLDFDFPEGGNVYDIEFNVAGLLIGVYKSENNSGKGVIEIDVDMTGVEHHIGELCTGALTKGATKYDISSMTEDQKGVITIVVGSVTGFIKTDPDNIVVFSSVAPNEVPTKEEYASNLTSISGTFNN